MTLLRKCHFAGIYTDFCLLGSYEVKPDISSKIIQSVLKYIFIEIKCALKSCTECQRVIFKLEG